MLHTDFPEGLAKIPAGHEELQGVLVRALKRESTTLDFSMTHRHGVENERRGRKQMSPIKFQLYILL